MKEESTYRLEPLVHVVADGVVATLLRLDHTEHALLAVLEDRAVEELLLVGLDRHVDYICPRNSVSAGGERQWPGLYAQF